MQISSQRLALTPRSLAAASTPLATTAPAPAEAARARDVAPAGSPLGSQLARLDGLADALLGRLRAAAADAPEGEHSAFRAAAEGLESGLARLRAGLADGSLAPADVQRGVQNALANARQSLDEGRNPETQAPEVGDAVRSRFQGLAKSILARIEGLPGAEDERGALAASVAEAFESAAARLDAALFDPRSGDPIDRGTYRDLFSQSLGALQAELGALFGGAGFDGERLGGKGGPGLGVIYGSDQARDRLAPAPGRVDLAG